MFIIGIQNDSVRKEPIKLANILEIEPIKQNKQTFANNATNYSNASDIALNVRKCLPVQDDSILQEKTERLFKQIAYAFEKSGLIKYASTKESSLPIISSPTGICFFRQISSHFQYLIVDVKLSNEQKITVLDNLFVEIDNSKLLHEQKIIAKDLVASVSRCLQLSSDINKTTIWKVATYNEENVVNCFSKKVDDNIKNPMLVKQLMLYPISIDLLFIEENKRFKKSLLNDKNKIIDIGAHALDDEWFYMERCYRGFLYLLNLQQQTKNTRINFAELRSVNAILGGHNAYINTCYCCSVANDMGYEFLMLIKQGLITDKNFTYSRNKLSAEERMQELQAFLEDKLDINIPLKQVTFNDKIYFVVDEFQEITTKPGLNQQDQQLLDDLHGKTNNKAFIFSISNREDEFSDTHPIILHISYCYNKDRALVCQQLLDIYYKKITEFPESIIRKINLAVSLCSIIQRIHPFCDANGRTLFFILLPILLYQMGKWLTRMIRYPWTLLEFMPAAQITSKVLSLCIDLPKFEKPVEWHKYITITENMRISVALGDLTKIKELTAKQPSLLSDPIIISPASDPISLLEHSIRNKQLEVFQFLLNNLSKEQLTSTHLINMLVICDQLECEEIKAILIAIYRN